MAKVQFTSNIGTVKKALKQQLEMAAEIIGGKAESYAKVACPKDTGNLQNSITHTTEDGGHTVVIGTPVKYAPYVELGTGVYAEGGGGRQTPWRYQDRKGKWHTTSGAHPHPYLRPAIEDHIDEYKNVLEKCLKD